MEGVYLLAILCFSALACVTHGDDDYETTALSYDAETFSAGIKQSIHFVMFYAPWCGHCKNLAPVWNELAKFYKAEKSPVVIAKVDCTVHTGLCADHDVVGFPTLKLFTAGGSKHKRYSGKRDHESLKKFIHDQIHGVEAPSVPSKEAGRNVLDGDENEPGSKSSPAILTTENFESRIEKGLFFIEFFAPWCGHCKKLIPVWDDLAETFNHGGKVTIAKIDCTQYEATCREHEIKGYPTLLLFKDGKKTDKYQGSRNQEALKKYLSSKVSGNEEGGDDMKLPDTLKDSNSQSNVRDLTDKTFDSHLSISNLVFVEFFAPWCGHCKQLAPIWEELAKGVLNQPVSIAKVDCTIYRKICEQNQVRGYPTLKLFHKGEYVQDYKGVRSFENLHNFITKELKRHDEL